jgi:hypothetical protein
MDDEFDAGVGFATMGSICIVIATFLKNLSLHNPNYIIVGFLLSGFLMVFSSASCMLIALLKLNWDEENFIRFIIKSSIIVFFISSLTLLISYVTLLIS